MTEWIKEKDLSFMLLMNFSFSIRTFQHSLEILGICFVFWSWFGLVLRYHSMRSIFHVESLNFSNYNTTRNTEYFAHFNLIFCRSDYPIGFHCFGFSLIEKVADQILNSKKSLKNNSIFNYFLFIISKMIFSKSFARVFIFLRHQF